MTKPAATKLTASQRKFLQAVLDQAPGAIFHIRTVRPLFDAGYVFPRPGNILFWIVGCNGHAAREFALQEAGAKALGLTPDQYIVREAA